MTQDDPMWDDLWHGAAWTAFAQRVAETGGIPSSESVRKLAYEMYEQELRQKNDSKPPTKEGTTI